MRLSGHDSCYYDQLVVFRVLRLISYLTYVIRRHNKFVARRISLKLLNYNIFLPSLQTLNFFLKKKKRRKRKKKGVIHENFK